MNYLRIALLSTIIAVAVIYGFAAFASDGWQGRPSVCDTATGPRTPLCHDWVSTVKRPDIRTASCCGDGDAFIADDFKLIDGELYAIISLDYTDSNGVMALAKGTEIHIPREKINVAPEDANRSGHGVVFLITYNGNYVLCYFPPPLT